MEADFNAVAVEGQTRTKSGREQQLTRELTYSMVSPERVEDARMLARMGFGPSIITELTGWHVGFTRGICLREGQKPRGGRARSELSSFVRMPACHSAISKFVMALEQQLAFWGDRRLSARVLIRAIQHTQITMPDALAMVPTHGLYSIAVEVTRNNVKTVRCSQCRGHYAQLSLQSGLTYGVVYDCPVCRLINLMLPSRKHSVENCIPNSFADLKLRTPFTRYLSKGAEASDVQAIMRLAYGAMPQRVN